MIFIIPVIGLLCTTLMLFWLFPSQVKTGKLADLYTADSVRTLASLNPKSISNKLSTLTRSQGQREQRMG